MLYYKEGIILKVKERYVTLHVYKEKDCDVRGSSL